MKVKLNVDTFFEALITDGDPPCLRVALADSESAQYLVLQRSQPFVDPADAGVYVEVNDPHYSGYDRISSCEVTANAMLVRMSMPLGGRRNPIRSVEAVFKPAQQPKPEFIARLRAIFTGRETLLRVSGSPAG